VCRRPCGRGSEKAPNESIELSRRRSERSNALERVAFCCNAITAIPRRTNPAVAEDHRWHLPQALEFRCRGPCGSSAAARCGEPAQPLRRRLADDFIRRHAEGRVRTRKRDLRLRGGRNPARRRGTAAVRPRTRVKPKLPWASSGRWQSHGVGTELQDRTVLAARNRGIKQLHITCLSENQRMQQLAANSSPSCGATAIASPARSRRPIRPRSR